MEIEYEFTIDDAQAGAKYFVYHKPVSKKQMNVTRRRFMLFAALYFVVAILFAMVGHLALAVIFGLLAVIWIPYYFFYPGIFRKSAIKTVLEQQQRLLPNNKLKQKITISNETLTKTTTEATTTCHWSLVEDVFTFEQHLFIETRGYGTIINPERAFASEEAFQQFVGEVKSLYQKAKTTK